MENEEKDINNKLLNEENNIIVEDNNKKDNNQINENSYDISIKNNISLLLKKIFKFNEQNQNFLTIINLDCGKHIKELFNNGLIPKYKNKEDLIRFIKEKIYMIHQIKTIIGKSYEIVQIIIVYLNKDKIFPIEYLIDLYFELVNTFNSEKLLNDKLKENEVNNELINDLKISVNWLLCTGFLQKKNLDYIYQKISELQLENNLNNYLFYNYLDLIELLYGKNYNKDYKENLISKNYLYFYDKEKSGIKTNITNDKNNIKINDGITIIMWFYLNNPIEDDKNYESILCEMKINDEHIFEFILDNDDIVIKYNDKLLKNEQDKNLFNISKYQWTQFKIQITKDKIKLNIFQGDIKSSINYQPLYYDENENKIHYKTKIYSLKDISNFDINNSIIKSLNFFKNYIGLVGTIIFCNNNNPSETPIYIEYGLKSNKISNFIGELGLLGIYFIFAPPLFIYEKNQFIDLTNNIIGEINNDKYDIDKIQFNNVYQYKNLFNNIYNLGGTVNILPLFEMFYKFTIKNNIDNDEEILLYNIFKKLMSILELIFINKKKNYLEALYSNKMENHSFFEVLQLFLEIIDEKYYQIDNEILNSLINIGKAIFKYCSQKETNDKEIFIYFKYILFYPKIIIKFNLSQQELLWNFFEVIKTSENNFNYSYYKKLFMSFEQMNNFFLLLSHKYGIQNNIDSKQLMNIIRNIFEDSSTNDKERENLLLLYNSNNLNNNILIGIIEIFIFYFDINKNSIIEKYSANNPDKSDLFKDFKDDDIKESILKSRNNSINYFLNSQNNFIETLLNIFSTENINLKKVVLNLLKILSHRYKDNFENYFTTIDSKIKKSKGKLIRINKKDFYYFIQENIIPNQLNQKLDKIKVNHNNENKHFIRRNLFRGKTTIELRKIKINKKNNTEDNNRAKSGKNNNFNIIIENEEKKEDIHIKEEKNENKENSVKKNNKSDDNKSDDEEYDKNKKHLKLLDDDDEINEIKKNRSLTIKKIDISNIKQNLLNKIKSNEKNENEIISNEHNKELENHRDNYSLENNTEDKFNLNQNNIIYDKEKTNNEPQEEEKLILKEDEKKNNKEEEKTSQKSNDEYNENMIIESSDNKIEDNNLNIEEDKLNLKEIQKINCEISMILFDWLLTIDYKNKNSIEKNQKKNKIKTNNSDVENIINFLIKFLTNIKEIEVIYKLLFIIVSQKSLGVISKIGQNDEISSNLSNNYYRLLNYFSFTNTKFLQLIEELIINSYLCIHDENSRKKYTFTSDNIQIRSGLNNKDEYFKIIYSKSKELLMDIYFHENNENKNEIIYNLMNIILLLSNQLKIKNTDNEDTYKFNIFLELLKDILTTINDLYWDKMDYNKFKNNFIEENNLTDLNKINNKNNNKTKEKVNIEDIINDNYENYSYSLIKYYISLGPLIFEYCFLIKNCNNFIFNSSNDSNTENFMKFPDFLKNINDINIYIKFYKKISTIFDINKLLSSIKTKNINKFDTNKEIYIFSVDEMSKLINEYIYNKDNRNKFKRLLELLFIKYNNSGYSKQFPLVEILTIINNYIIELYFNSDEENKSNDFQKINIFINSHQFFLIYLIFTSCNIKENDNYTFLNTTYKDIQELFYNLLLYNINNIIKNFKLKMSPFFIIVFNNILSLISRILIIANKKEGKFLNKTCVKKLFDYYNSKCSSFFNNTNIVNYSKNEMTKNESIIIDKKTFLMQEIIEKYDKNIDKFVMEIFQLNKFETIYKQRKIEIKNLKLILNNNPNNFNEEDINNYENIYLNVKNLKIPYEYDDIRDSYNKLKKRKKYRTIKKYLYSWNNSYSNLNAFYREIRNKNLEKENGSKETIILKYKISNFLSKDLSRKLLEPIYDFDYYMPNFRQFDYKNKLFEKKENEEDTQEIIYKIDLKIFEEISDINLPENENHNYFFEEVCYIQTTHHIRGKIFISKDNNINDIYFSTNEKCLLSNEKLKNYEDYDISHCSCFGSIFRNNMNQKDSEIYLKINYSEINFIFLRKYCFRNNSFEIYTNKHKSYYFKFYDDKKRNLFIDYIINKFNKIAEKKQLFKSIKGIDENNKTITMGYYKDEDNNKEYSNIANIKDLWKSNKISKLEYLMWINIYGNRSFRDIAQYPVFPWLLNNYEDDSFEDLIKDNENIRDFRLPMGMLFIDDKSKKRQEGYIETFKIMVMDLYNDNLIKLKMKEEDFNEEPQVIETPTKRHSANIEETNTYINLNRQLSGSLKNSKVTIDKDSISTNNKTESVIIIEPKNILSLLDKTEEKLPKFLDYNFNIDKLYNNLNIEYERIPYCFGSHFSNGMYVSHYLCRLFPYSLTMIEIQGNGFDCPDRLFLNIQNSFYSAISEKSDLREIIPEFFTIPEIFLNINSFDLGKVQIKNDEEDMEDNNEKIETKLKNNENVTIDLEDEEESKQVEDVELPQWCQNNPYSFVEKIRILFECNNLNINPWIDIIFGYLQRGTRAQSIGNIYLPHVYDGVMNLRLKSEEIINNREENEFKMRFFELGVNPTKVFEKKCKSNKNKINDQLISKSSLNEESGNILHEIKLKNDKNKVIYFNTKYPHSEEIFIIDKSFIEQKMIIQENKELNNYVIKDTITYKELPIKKKIEKSIEYKLIMKPIFKGAFHIITGLFDGELYISRNINKVLSKKEEKENQNKEDLIIKSFDKSLITSLEISKDEKYFIYGTQKGSLVIFSLNYFLFKEGKNFIDLIKFFPSHTGFAINCISISSDLNLFADCAYDGYAHIYTLPKCKLIHSIYIESNLKNNYFSLDFVFLSAQPLASIILYSNKTYNFKSFNINGNELKINNDYDEKLIKDNKNNNIDSYEKGMSSPIIFTDSQFNDYLLYILNKKFVLIKKLPFMENVVMFNPSLVKEEYLNNIAISNDLKYLYIYEELNNKIYIIHHKNNISIHTNKENKELKDNKENKIISKKSGLQ